MIGMNLYLSAFKLIAGLVLSGLFHCFALGQGISSSVIRGAVSNDRAEPVPNARVDVSTAAPVFGAAVFCPSCYLDCQKWTTTDNDGRFEITDLDSRLKFRLVVSAAGYTTSQTGLIAPSEKLNELTLRERPKKVDHQRIIQGTVKNSIGVAVQGALIEPVMTINEAGLRSSSTEGVAAAVTDATGQFEIDLVDGVFGIDIEIAAEGLCNRRFIELKPSDDNRTFELFEGAHIVGKVDRSGRPVSGMTISVAQTDHSSSGEKFFLRAVPATTNSQGRFELRNLLPDQEYCVYSVIGEADRTNSAAVVKTQKFVAPSSGKTIDLGSLTPVQPASFRGKLVHEGADAIEKVVLLLKRAPAWDMIQVAVAADGSFRIEGLPPEVYEVCLASDEFDLDADKIDSLLWSEKSIKKLIDKSITDFVLPIRASKSDVPDLKPNGIQNLSGRVLDIEDKGVPGISVSAADSVETLGKGLGEGKAPWTDTDSDGQFTLTELPETRVWLKIHRPNPDGRTFKFLGMIKPNLNASSLTIQLGPETAFEINNVSGREK